MDIDQHRVAETLNRYCDHLLKQEIIGDYSVFECLEYVDLEVEHTPVIRYRGEGEAQAVQVIGRTRGGKYLVPMLEGVTPVAASELAVMRCRYLLTIKARQKREFGPLCERMKANVPALYSAISTMENGVAVLSLMDPPQPDAAA